ncbi:MAG: PQQ-binding-like beta-propeller repeat protein [Verrucomicrobiae bacterium]
MCQEADPPPKPAWPQVLVAALILEAALGAAFFFWAGRQASAPVDERQPGMDRSSAGTSAQPSPFLAGKLVAGTGLPAALAGAWPGFRGPNGDGVAADRTAIGQKWAPLWTVDLGEGFAGAAVRDGRVYVLDYDQEISSDALRCLSLADGGEIWRFTYPVKVKRNHGMSRTTPTLAGRYVVSLGPKCHVVCLDSTTGQFVWGIDLVNEYSAEVPEWYAGQCPLVDRGRVILAPGGDALLIAVDLATGRVAWKTPNPNGWKMTHASILPVEFSGRRQYVYCGSRGVAGISADDGSILWETDQWAISIATVPTPVDAGGGKLFFSGGYNSGAKMLQLTESGGKVAPVELFRLRAAAFGATQQTPILYREHIYGVRPDGQLACLDLTGKVVWTSACKFGLGPFLIADGKIFLMNDEGVLTLAEASPSGYRQLAQSKVLSGQDSWAPMALAGSRLLARDLTRMVCLDVSGGGP